MAIEQAPVRNVQRSQINPAPYNPRIDLEPEHDQYQRLRRGLGDFGLVDVLTWNERTGHLVGGHQRLRIIDRDRGYDPVTQTPDYEIRVAVVDLPLDREKALNVLLNNPEAAGEWDMPKLADLMMELQETDTGVAPTGYTPEEAEDIIAWGSGGTHQPSETTEDDFSPELPEDPKSQPGEIYELGRHRLICGDSRDPAVLERLLTTPEGERIRPVVLWTDPPYGVDYEGGTGLKIQGDTPEGLHELLLGMFKAATPHLADHARFYIAGPAGPQGLDFRLAIRDAGWHLHEVLVWGKDTLVLGHSDYHYQHEDVLYGSHQDIMYGWAPGEAGRPGRGGHAGSRWYGDNKQTTLFLVPRPKRSAEHPTMKPIRLIEPHLRNSSKPGDPVLDICAGSGSTMMAAEQLDRSAYLVEIDPRYCDAIRQRFADWTGDANFAP